MQGEKVQMSPHYSTDKKLHESYNYITLKQTVNLFKNDDDTCKILCKW